MINYSERYRKELLDNVIPFWEEHSLDDEHGGYFTCLDRRGNVFDRDKFIWLQGRQAWMFAMLYNSVAQKPQWLEISKKGIDFLKDYARNDEGDFYFSTTAAGEPLVEAYNIFSDCFAAMAFSQYAKASGDQAIAALARNTYKRILARKDAPKGRYEKSTGIRPLKSFALPMILSNLVLEMEEVLEPSEVEDTLDFAVNEVMEVFLDKKSGLIYEFVKPDGSHEDSFNGRLLNPGHGIEAMWFMMDIGARRNDQALIDKAIETTLNILESSWDEAYGGIYYFLDAKGHPPQQLEWDQKLWWVHLETLVALAKAYEHSKDSRVMMWYEKVHEYAWSHFADPEHGEWFGYLNRQGEVLLNLKGGKWKVEEGTRPAA